MNQSCIKNPHKRRKGPNNSVAVIDRNKISFTAATNVAWLVVYLKQIYLLNSIFQLKNSFS